MTLHRAAAAATLACLALLVAPAPVSAEFRGDERGARSYEYNDEYFLNLFSYRPRLTHRWVWANAGSARWRWFWSDTALGYNVTAGSVRSDELYLHQEAIVRLPFSNNITAEYRFVESEDYDSRWLRNEVELLFRFFRPAYTLPLLDTVGRTPPEDGLFFGGQGLLDADKENADLGAVVGWRGDAFGVRVDLVRPDFFYNGKSKDASEYTSEPLTFRAKVGARLLGGDLELLAWFEDDLPLRLELPDEQEVFRSRQLEAGFAARWTVTSGVRVDLEASAERTREGRRPLLTPSAPAGAPPPPNEDTNREAARVFVAGEVDVAPLLESSSRAADVVLLGLHAHALDEDTRTPGRPRSLEVTRGEVFAELGYVLGLPTFSPEYVFGLRVQTQNGFIGLRHVEPADGRHTVSERFMSKVGVGLEVVFREGLGLGFFQFTFRVDEATFGGGNAQVMMRF
jgi:hypothetical protein